MKILQVHNYYQLPGGEDTVVKNEYDLLISKSNVVKQYFCNNKEIKSYKFINKIQLLYKSVYNKETYFKISKIIKQENPDICHVHNTLSLISPSVYFACKDNNIPVVQTLHNYRLLCSNGYLFRSGEICEQCLGKSLYNSVKYGCYRDSRLETLALANIIEFHKFNNTWDTKIDAYIALTNFAKSKFVAGGISAKKIFVKTNFQFNHVRQVPILSDYFLFAGRLDKTKGINLLTALKNSSLVNNIKIAGSGAEIEKIIKLYGSNYLGQLNSYDFNGVLSGSLALLFPSVWYEGMPMTIIEAFSHGKPVIASNLGAMAELIEDGVTGLLFKTNDLEDLQNKLYWALNNKDKMIEMGKNAYKVYLEKYTPEKNYEMMMNIYNSVIENYK